MSNWSRAQAFASLIGLTLAGLSGTAAASPTAAKKHRSVAASPPHQHLCPLFRVFDVDHDGKLDPAEENEMKQKVFVEADLDADGRVSPEELTQSLDRLVLARVHVRFSQLDRNKDQRIERAEVGKMALDRFERFDLDHNSEITEPELARVMLKLVSARVERWFASLDANHDHRLSFRELGFVHDERVARAETPSS